MIYSALSLIFAFIPVIIWLFFLYDRRAEKKNLLFTVFIFGALSALILLELRNVWLYLPFVRELDLSLFRQRIGATLIVFIFFGALEEIVKMSVVVLINKKTDFIINIRSSMRYFLASALGFAFVENVFYLYAFWGTVSVSEFFSIYIYRSLVTICAHMLFSGIVGYFYALSKFSDTFFERDKWLNKKHRIVFFIKRVFKIHESFQLIIKGLLIAIVLHVFYNAFVQFDSDIFVIVLLFLGFVYLIYLLRQKTSRLIFREEEAPVSTDFLKEDSEIVIELIGMWFNDGRYIDVIQICNRFLEKDPSNKVVQLFKTKAIDKIRGLEAYKDVKESIVGEKGEINKNVLSKFIKEQDTIEKVKKKVEEIKKNRGISFDKKGN